MSSLVGHIILYVLFPKSPSGLLLFDRFMNLFSVLVGTMLKVL